MRVDSVAGWRARATADGVGVAASGPYRDSRANVRASSRADYYGDSHARAVKIEVKR